MGASKYREILWQDVSPKVFKGARVRVKTVDGPDVTSEVLDREKLHWLFRFPFVGKGSPEQVQATIQLLYRFRQNKATVEQFAGGGAKKDEYNFIGLDCNGFVGNYLQRVSWKKYDWLNQNNLHHPGPDSLIKDLFLDSTRPVYSLEDFKTRGSAIYLFVFCAPDGTIYDHGHGPGGAGHIMITDPGVKAIEQDGVRFKVSESTAANINGSGGGPVTSDYVVHEMVKEGDHATRTGAVFSVWRGGKPSMPMNVKIGSVK
jgi:hypothetical protein